MAESPDPAMKMIHRTDIVSRLSLVSRLLAGNAGLGEKFEQTVAEVANTFELAEFGIRWPVPGTAQFQVIVGDSTDSMTWSSDSIERLMQAKSFEESWVDAEDGRRLFVPLLLEGRRNGAVWIRSHEPIDDETGRFLIVVVQSLIRLPSFQEKLGPPLDSLRITQRLQDAATIGGKIAHDFDNVFTGVVGFAEMVQGMLEPASLPHQYVSEIISAGNRGIAFTQQLHQLSRSATARPVPSSVSLMLNREEARLKKLPLATRLQFAAANDLPPIAMDASALQQAVGHLLDNAVEASPPGGTVRVSATLIELSELEAREFLGAASAGSYVELRIADEGSGVREDHRKKLFVEPFFTTKVRHRGLGLAVVMRILTAHRGGVRHEPAGRGSIFHVVLPLAAARSVNPGGCAP